MAVSLSNTVTSAISQGRTALGQVRSTVDGVVSDVRSQVSSAATAIGQVIIPPATAFAEVVREAQDVYMQIRSFGSDVLAAVEPARVISDSLSGAAGLSAIRFPTDIGKYYLRLDFARYEFPSFFAPLALSGSGTICLPVPANLVDEGRQRYEEDELGTILGGGAHGAASTSVSQVTDALTGSQSVASILAAIGTTAKDALIGLGTSLFGDAGKAAGALTGQVANPFMTVFYRGPTFKTHEFTWRLSPRNRQESDVLRDLIRELKRHQHPYKINSGVLLGYPDLVIPKLQPNEEYLYAFKPCVIERVVVNHVPGGVPSFYAGTGAPAEVELRISLMEVEVWTSEDFGGGYQDAPATSGTTTEPTIPADGSTSGSTPSPPSGSSGLQDNGLFGGGLIFPGGA